MNGHAWTRTSNGVMDRQNDKFFYDYAPLLHFNDLPYPTVLHCYMKMVFWSCIGSKIMDDRTTLSYIFTQVPSRPCLFDSHLIGRRCYEKHTLYLIPISR